MTNLIDEVGNQYGQFTVKHSMNSFILSREELQAVTGLVRPGPQKKLLMRRGIHFTVDTVGKPVVTRSAVEAAGSTMRGKGFAESERFH